MRITHQDTEVIKPVLETGYMAAILITVDGVNKLKTWLAINEETILDRTSFYELHHFSQN